ncbi:MAG: four helix bundle protein [Bacteroidales bacterium]|nr:four helix bundle protein [Bacteroidales bacterium]
MAKAKSFEELEIWQKSIDLAIDFYSLVKKEPLSKDYSLCDQIKRAAVSVSNNIAEGFEYGSNKQFVRFLFIAKGSLGELRSMVFLLDRLKFIEDDLSINLKTKCTELAKMISSLIKYLENHINN